MTAAMDDRCDTCGVIASCCGTCRCDPEDLIPLAPTKETP